jgi:hypothetical protein
MCCQFLWQCAPALAAFDQSHKLFTAELKKFVDDSGVHYSKWKSQQQGLNAYISSLETITPAEYAAFTLDQGRSRSLSDSRRQKLQTLKLLSAEQPSPDRELLGGCARQNWRTGT